MTSEFTTKLASRLAGIVQRLIPARLGNPVTRAVGVQTDADTIGSVWVHDIVDDPAGVTLALNSGRGRIAVSELRYGRPVLLRRVGQRYLIDGVDPELDPLFMAGVADSARTAVRAAEIDIGLIQATKPPSMRALVSEGLYTINNTPYLVDDMLTRDFSTDIPSTSGGAVAVLVELDLPSVTLSYKISGEFRAALTHKQAFRLWYPMPNIDRLAIGYIKLIAGMSAINNTIHIFPAQALLTMVSIGGILDRIITDGNAPLLDDNGNILWG